MPDINIHAFITGADAYDFSGSIAERGNNAARETFGNAVTEAGERPLLTARRDLDAWRKDLAGSGYGSGDEVETMPDAELNALFIQWISGDIREAQSLCPGDGPGDIDWTEHSKLAEQGTLAGRMFVADIGDNAGEVFFYVGD